MSNLIRLPGEYSGPTESRRPSFEQSDAWDSPGGGRDWLKCRAWYDESLRLAIIEVRHDQRGSSSAEVVQVTKQSWIFVVDPRHGNSRALLFRAAIDLFDRWLGKLRGGEP